MDPLTLALGVGLFAGVVAFDARGADYLQQIMIEKLRREALSKSLRVDQPTESYFGEDEDQ